MDDITNIIKREEAGPADFQPDVNLKRALSRQYSHGPLSPFENKMLLMDQNLRPLIPEPNGLGNILMFLGSQRGVGNSTLVREYAKVSSGRMNRRVLVVDSGSGEAGHAKAFGVETLLTWNEAISENKSMMDTLKQIGDTRLYYTQLVSKAVTSDLILDSPEMLQLFESLRRKFHMILLDVPALQKSTDALALCRATQGVVLTVEAEKTNWHAARRSLDQIRSAGGNVVGIMLNKRRFHIPARLYKLF